VSLLPDSVGGFVFWTKNVGPFVPHLDEVRRRGFPFVVQHTINNYPRFLEQAVVEAAKAVEHIRRIAEEYGPKVCVWRYDTIIHSSVTPRDFHIETFTQLAKKLEGATDEVVISFARFYKKTLRNMKYAGAQHGFTWSEPADEWKRNLLVELTGIATAHRIRLTICSQPHLLVSGSGEARCVDANRLYQVGGTESKTKLKGSRKECGCYESRDIGEYDTCPHGCIYCYAVQNRPLALQRLHEHDPTAEFLVPPPPRTTEAEPPQKRIPLSLFDGLESQDV
jgi:hypothetical protein